MENLKVKHILIVLGTLLIVWAIFQIPSCESKPKPQYWEDPNFKPETVYVDKPYPVKGDSFPYKVPPIVVIKWKDRIIPGHINCIDDSLILVIDSLGREMRKVNKQFLLQFPESPKLVGGLFKLDTMKLDLLETTGSITSKVYPVDYNRFEYEWHNNSIRAKELTNKKPTGSSQGKKLNHSFYVQAGYSILSKVPIISSDYYLRYKRLQLDLEPRVTIEKNPTLELNAKLGVRIK